MSDTESHQASIDASEASIPAENGPREVANDPPPLGSAEERENDHGVAAWQSESWPRAGNPGHDLRKTDRTETSILASRLVWLIN